MKIEITHHWLKLDVLCGEITITRNQNIQLQIDSDERGDTYIDLSKYEAKQISNMLLNAIGELDDEELDNEPENSK